MNGIHRRDPDVLSRRIGGEILLANIHGDGFFLLDGTAAEIWLLLEQGGSLGELVKKVARSHGISVGDISHDVASFVADLERDGWVRAVAE